MADLVDDGPYRRLLTARPGEVGAAPERVGEQLQLLAASHSRLRDRVDGGNGRVPDPVLPGLGDTGADVQLELRQLADRLARPGQRGVDHRELVRRHQVVDEDEVAAELGEQRGGGRRLVRGRAWRGGDVADPLHQRHVGGAEREAGEPEDAARDHHPGVCLSNPSRTSISRVRLLPRTGG